ncbi:MAG: cytochrome c3 family protein [Chloroflexi bacterium]|nr:cytochrome c3 family protein [Chloroflexota bacterium]
MRSVTKALGFIAALFLLGAVLILTPIISLATRLIAGLTRKRLAMGLALLAILVGIGSAVGYFWVSRGFAEIPSQPVDFPHSLHAGALGVSCLFCHRGAATNPAAEFPSVEQCMFCHRVIGKGNPEVEKVVAAWEAGQPINWLRINRLPDHVHFDHQAHSLAGVTCSTCHGQVEGMAKIHKIRSLKMKDCLSCHRAKNAPTECSTCHY